MIKATIIPAMTLFFAMLVSCDLFPDSTPRVPNTLVPGSFYAQNLTNSVYYTVKADMLYQGAKCEIWAEQGSEITEEDAKAIAAEYDGVIRQRIVDVFSEKDFTYIDSNGIGLPFDDMLDFANWLVGRNDGKLTILLLDIKDTYNEETNKAYVAGYFDPGNFLSKRIYPYSNGRDMIYVDTSPGLKHRRQAFATFAHELQHLINYVTRVRLKKTINTDIWVNEGLSTYAEYLYLGENPVNRCEWIIDDRNTIEKGNNFFVWGNHNEEQYSTLDDYATVYLFFRWLYLQANTGLQSHIFHDIVVSDNYDYRAVTGVATQINPTWSNWELLLKTWFTANYDPGNVVYGYKGDAYLQEGHGSDNSSYKGVRINPIAIDGNTISLYPGEGVYSIISGPYSTTNATNIRYEELSGNTDNMLLTFNANPNNLALEETGSLTGVSASITVSRSAARNAQTRKITDPYVIDARDLLGRDWDKTNRLPR